MTQGEFAILVVVVAIAAIVGIRSAIHDLSETNERIFDRLGAMASTLESIDLSVTELAESHHTDSN